MKSRKRKAQNLHEVYLSIYVCMILHIGIPPRRPDVPFMMIEHMRGRLGKTRGRLITGHCRPAAFWWLWPLKGVLPHTQGL